MAYRAGPTLPLDQLERACRLFESSELADNEKCLIRLLNLNLYKAEVEQSNFTAPEVSLTSLP